MAGTGRGVTWWLGAWVLAMAACSTGDTEVGAGSDGSAVVDGAVDGGREADAASDAGPDAGGDASPDVDAASDAGPDAGEDAGPDVDAGGDAGPDAGPGDDAGPDGGLDAGPGDDAGPDAGLDAGGDAGPDAGLDAGGDAGPDAGFGTGTQCDECERDADCAEDYACVPFDAGGRRACLQRCGAGLPSCPAAGFECAETTVDGVSGSFCSPVGGRCCVDADGDAYGSGMDCLGMDCDETRPEVNPGATEVCNGLDDDCSGLVDDGVSGVLCPSGDGVTASACVDGTCRIEACTDGWGDCDRATSNGCETSLRTVSNCGACGTACAPANATGDCSSGSCTVGTCDDGWGDCDRDPSNGCETSLRTLTDCGGCGVVCAPAHGTGNCSSGRCTLRACDTGWEECDGNPSNGCETSVRTLTDCGDCGIACDLPNATESCTSGRCTLVACDDGWGDCNRVEADGCEAQLTTSTNCGACGVRCSLDGARSSCASGTCTLLSCLRGRSNCDGDDANGCEVIHASAPTSCRSAPSVGSFAGDTACGSPRCSASSWTQFRVRRGLTSAWFKARALEESNCAAAIEHRIRLDVPSGVNFDLYVYSSCGTLVASSRRRAGVSEEVTISASDLRFSNDSFDYWVEVRHVRGTTCTPWTLRFDGRTCM